MPFSRPTLSELIDRTQQDAKSRLELSSPILRRSLIAVILRVLAGAVHMLYGALEFLSRQIFPDLSDGDYLIRQAQLFGLSLRGAEFASGTCGVTGTDGAEIPEGTVLERPDGQEYVTAGLVTIASGVGTLNVTAKLAGADGNCDAATSLMFESPITGVNAAASVAAGAISNGSDEETIDSLRTRLLARLQLSPHGGAAHDYIAWAKEVAGVTRAWCFPLEDGPGTVTVRFVRDGDTNIIPDAGEIAVVQAYLDVVRPVTADVTVGTLTGVPLNFTIGISPDTAATRAAVQAELEDLILRVGQPAGVLLKSQINTAVGTADGVTDYTVTIPTGDVAFDADEMPTMGTITWI